MKELSSEARALIRRVGTADGPVASDRIRVKRRVVAALAGAGTTLGGSGVAAGAPVAFGAAAGGKVTLASVALWLATGAGLGTAVSSPALVSAYRRAEAARAPVVAAAVTPANAAERANEPPRTAERAATASEAPAIPATGEAFHETPRADVPRRASRPDTAPVAARVSPNAAVAPEKSAAAPVTPAASHATSPVVSTGATSLAEETRLLQAAQRELARKNTAAALALLEEHATRYPHGALAQERSAARVLALCDLGRTAEARKAAEAFVRASPQSPLVPRLRGSCALSVAPEHEQRP